MPIFDFSCKNKKCNHKKEFIVSFSDDDPERECPECKGVMKKDEKIYKTSWKPNKSFFNGGYESN